MPSLVDHIRLFAQRPYVRLAVLSAAAAAVAYGLGSLTYNVSAVVAAITALVAIRPTFHASLQEVLRQLVGVVCGAAFTFAALQLIGFSAVAIFLTVLACFIAAKALRLGEEGAVAVAVTVILVVGPHFNTEAIETRLLGVLLGSAIALVMSFFTRRGTPHGRALADVVEQGDRTSALLATIGRNLATSKGNIAESTAADWLAEAEDILARAVEIRYAAEDAVSGSRWSPMINRAETEAVLDQVRITEGTALTVVSMCRDLVVASDHERAMPAGLATSISGVLLATADAITEQSDGARDNPAEVLADYTGPVGVVTRSRKEAAVEVRSQDDTRPLLLGGSLLRDSEKITEILSGH